MSVPRARLLDLLQARCQIFATTFNPEGVRTGNKVLRQRLRGPALVDYYPRRLVTFNDIRKEFGNEFVMENEPEKERLRQVEALKTRGKGAPKKKKGPPGMSISPFCGSLVPTQLMFSSYRPESKEAIG
ncbi:hypothetical protein RB594_005143 [Gaeumannomyces avenae]